MKTFLIFFVVLIAKINGQNEEIGGGYAAMPLTDSKLPELLSFAQANINLEGDTQYSNLILLKAESQIVSGINYRLSFTASETGNCETTNTCHERTCVAVIYDIAWENSRKLTNYSCS